MSSPSPERSRDFERFVTFIDAIVAIAITLLVLPLVDLAPELRDVSAAHLLAAHEAEIGAFLLSFVVIASFWSAQHAVISSVVAHDRVVTRLMMLWTLTIVVLPFPTAMVSVAGDQAATKIFYIGTMAINSAVLGVMAWAVGRNRSVRDREQKPDVLPGLLTAAAFVVALAITLIFPGTSYYPLLIPLVPQLAVDVWRARRRKAHAR